MTDDNPLLAEIRYCGVSCWYRVNDIGGIAQHIEIGVSTLGTQSGIVSCDHGIAQHHIFVESFPVVEQRSHEGRGAVVGDSACSVRPSQQRPSASRRLAIWNQYDAG